MMLFNFKKVIKLSTGLFYNTRFGYVNPKKYKASNPILFNKEKITQH